jgi:hypothetical protein
VSSVPYPTLTNAQDLIDLPIRTWVECANCREDEVITEGASQVKAFVDTHVYIHPGHTRYRVVGQAAFSVPLPADLGDSPAP